MENIHVESTEVLIILKNISCPIRRQSNSVCQQYVTRDHAYLLKYRIVFRGRCCTIANFDLRIITLVEASCEVSQC